MVQNNTGFAGTDIIGAGAQLAGSALEAGIGYINTVETNKANKEIAAATNEANKEIAAAANALQQDMFNSQMDYNRAVQQENWARADTQFSRASLDAINAGLSPLAVLENAQNIGGMISAPNSPQMHVPTMQSAQMNPMNPAYFGGFQDFGRSIMQIIAEDKRLSSTEKIEKLRREEETYRFEQQLRTTTALTNKQLNLENSRKSKELQEQIREFNKNLEFTVSEANKKYKLSEMDTLSSYVMKMTGGASGSYKTVSDYNEWSKAISAWASSYAEKSASITANYESYSKSASGSGNVGAGVKLGPIGANGDIGASGSTSKSETKDFSVYWKHNMASWLAENPLPVYFGH